jgi:hypothetical protein
MSIERPFVGDYNLHIRNVRYDDRGEYTCTINTIPVQIKRIRLIVKGNHGFLMFHHVKALKYHICFVILLTYFHTIIFPLTKKLYVIYITRRTHFQRRWLQNKPRHIPQNNELYVMYIYNIGRQRGIYLYHQYYSCSNQTDTINCER